MNTIVQTEVVNQEKFIFIFEDVKRPSIEYRGVTFYSLAELIQKATFLSDSRYFDQFIRIANFLFRGLEFDVIDDINEFKKRYQENANHTPPEYGVYDITSMVQPVVTEGKALFFVEKNATGIPYRVVCTYPYADEFSEYSYSLFPASK